MPATEYSTVSATEIASATATSGCCTLEFTHGPPSFGWIKSQPVSVASWLIEKPFVRVGGTSATFVGCVMPADSFAVFAATGVGFTCLVGHFVAVIAFV